MALLKGSVGKGGKNNAADVMVVKLYLAQAGLYSGLQNEICNRATMQAIERFQHGFMEHPTGWLDQRSETWTRLQHVPVPPKVPARAASVTMAAERQLAAVLAGPAKAAIFPLLPPALTAAAAAMLAKDGDARAYWTGHTRMTPPPEVNQGLVSPNPRHMFDLFGDPNDKKFKAHLSSMAVGPFPKVYGFTPALHSLNTIFAKVRVELPDLYELIRKDGMYNQRTVQNSTSPSNHSWAIAIDLIIGIDIVHYGSQFSMRGLDALAPYFNKAGWYWGGGYHTERRNDPMHFECGLALLQSFRL